MPKKLINLSLLVSFLFTCILSADDDSRAPINPVVDTVIKAIGGEDNLLDIFRFSERVLITATETPLMEGKTKANRSSVVKVGTAWWVGTAKRSKDKVRVLCWAWSLRILLDKNSKIETIPDVQINNKPVFGLRVTESITEPIDLFFDKETKRLTAIDYTDTRHVFSDWKKSAEGHHYPAHVAGFRFTDKASGTTQESQWYQTDILELTPLTELPSELK